MALITKTSQYTNVTRTMEIPQYEQVEFERRLLAWKNGNLLIQEAFPDLSENAREFIMTGMTSDEWDKLMGDDVYR